MRVINVSVSESEMDAALLAPPLARSNAGMLQMHSSASASGLLVNVSAILDSVRAVAVVPHGAHASRVVVPHHIDWRTVARADVQDDSAAQVACIGNF